MGQWDSVHGCSCPQGSAGAELVLVWWWDMSLTGCSLSPVIALYSACNGMGITPSGGV